MYVGITFINVFCTNGASSVLQMTRVAFKSQSSQSAVASDLVNSVENRDDNTQEGNERDGCLDRLS